MMHSTRWVVDSVTLLCLVSTLGVPGCTGDLTIVHPPQNETVMIDRRFKYHCRVAGVGENMKNIKIKWYHNGEEMPRRGQNYKINRQGTLRFTRILVVDRGKYHCKVENQYKESATSDPAYLTVHAEAVIIKKALTARTRKETVGSLVHIICQAAGIPTPIIKWKKNGELIPLTDGTNPLETMTESNTSQVSLSSRLKVRVTKSANYTCIAENEPVGGRAEDSVTIRVIADKAADQAFTPVRATQYCAPYNGTVCQEYLQGHTVVHNSTVGYDAEAALESHFKEIAALGLFSGHMGEGFCEGPARRLLCHLTFPDCYNDTNQPVSICQESCVAVKSLFCFRQLAELEEITVEREPLLNKGLLSLPDCLQLPSKWDVTQTCLESNHHEFSHYKVRDDCYVEKGRWYNGTVNMTRTGRTCQAWVDNFPQKHDRSPLIFPELAGAENFCRNPGGEEDQPWCYTTDKLYRWEPCDIDPCDLKEESVIEGPEEGGNTREPQKEEDDLTLLYIIGACSVVAVSLIIAILCFLWRYCRHQRYIATPQDDLDIDVESLPVNSAYHQMKSNRLNPKLETLEFPRNDIVFIEDIGQGAFGRVFKARIVCSNGNSHITGGKLSGSKHSLTCGKQCKNSRNIFSSKGDLKHLEIHASSKSCDSKLLGEHVLLSCDHDRDDASLTYSEGQLIAIKMLKEDASDTVLADFEREASLMVEFDHANIVRLLGVCTIGKPMCLLFEYMSKGDLNEFLRLCSPDQCLRRSNAGSNPSLLEESSSIDIKDQLHMARQIASGMVYLSDRGYVHRDLATRNCLVSNGLTVKISDFGLARSVHSMDYYHGSDKDAIPIRWMPPEAILYNKFSSQSDVWSFGVLLWEIFSFALQPYYGMTHEEVINDLRLGNILECPENTPTPVYDMMKSCWHRKPSSRPSFVSLHKSLNVMYEEVCRQEGNSRQRTKAALNV